MFMKVASKSPIANIKVYKVLDLCHYGNAGKRVAATPGINPKSTGYDANVL